MAAKNKPAPTAEVPATRNLSLSFLYTLAFLEGAAVIFAELIGSKMLGSFYGNSLLVWSCVVCITITALTAGYFLGGKLSKKGDKVKKLALLFAVSGFFMSLMPASLFFILE